MMLKEHERNVQIWKKEMEREEEEERIRREKRREEMAAKEKASELPPWPKVSALCSSPPATLLDSQWTSLCCVARVPSYCVFSVR